MGHERTRMEKHGLTCALTLWPEARESVAKELARRAADLTQAGSHDEAARLRHAAAFLQGRAVLERVQARIASRSRRLAALACVDFHSWRDPSHTASA